MTAQEIKASEGREYNASEWNRIIDRLSKYENVEFYQAAPQNGYDYYRYYAIYTLPEGLRILNTVSYGSCLHNGGFTNLLKYSADGITYTLFTQDFSKGEETYRAANEKNNRKYLSNLSKKYGMIFTTSL
jgi:hypothetical protein